MNRILIKSDREYLREVFSRIEKGKYAVPSFQRDFVWKEGQVLDLFDSIIKGYPIGAITLWHSEDQYKRKDILTDQESEDKSFEYYILDGRQRLTALYGCCYGSTKTEDKRFSLSYDLIEKKLVYSKNISDVWVVPISEIYDTFKMLGRMRLIQDSNIGSSEIRACNERLMQINTILQEYVVSEILIEKCSLSEASEVFSRINSKGTDINQREMLQAVAFGNSSGILISKEINKIKRKLIPYGFGDLDNSTIMNCFYKFANLNFYENNALDLAQYDFEGHLDDICSCLCRTAEFLHNECFVISSKLLPYSRQFIALSSFFKDIPMPNSAQKTELRRWFFYTTACQSFMNGSMSNVRSIFNKFDNFVNGISCEAGDYDDIKLPSSLKFKVSSRSALSNLLMITQVKKRASLMQNPSTVSLFSYYKLSPNPSSYFPLFSKEDKKFLEDVLCNNALFYSSDSYLEALFLTKEMLSYFSKGDIRRFEIERTAALVEGERELLESCGLTVVR